MIWAELQAPLEDLGWMYGMVSQRGGQQFPSTSWQFGVASCALSSAMGTLIDVDFLRQWWAGVTGSDCPLSVRDTPVEDLGNTWQHAPDCIQETRREGDETVGDEIQGTRTRDYGAALREENSPHPGSRTAPGAGWLNESGKRRGKEKK
ncbi:predicted protein [Chaetomium globosum CBS 148.51]|uniref:Uncharacterized protein n=1 Tax=Chaetomium globosum (strain ATCC 6205 / CBS 148.51 / DSM 1962 / NBRC 6347 / NRRL 1970) TaxID=306901 RepID=Q2H9E9_CHAGB|nr:uncharacterized protein CHGG_03155 [Chaetomium globosum CBS 148.51]EAQ91220.1 predicted protein [Chaetomium globosum CBS 148.51]